MKVRIEFTDYDGPDYTILVPNASVIEQSPVVAKTDNWQHPFEAVGFTLQIDADKDADGFRWYQLAGVGFEAVENLQAVRGRG